MCGNKINVFHKKIPVHPGFSFFVFSGGGGERLLAAAPFPLHSSKPFRRLSWHTEQYREHVPPAPDVCGRAHPGVAHCFGRVRFLAQWTQETTGALSSVKPVIVLEPGMMTILLLPARGGVLVVMPRWIHELSLFVYPMRQTKTAPKSRAARREKSISRAAAARSFPAVGQRPKT